MRTIDIGWKNARTAHSGDRLAHPTPGHTRHHLFQQVKPGGSGGEHLYAYQDQLRKVEHGNDGVIFTPILEPYVCGTRPSLLRDCAHTGFDTLEVWYA